MRHLEIQQLLANTPFDEAVIKLAELGVDAHTEDHKGKTYIHLDYSIFGDRSSNMVKECRGLALDKDTLDIVRFGFYRFLNLDETGRDPIEFDSKSNPVYYTEKLDGSLIILHYLDGEWIAGTRGRIFPDAMVGQFGITFPDLFWSIFKNKEALDPNYNYMFELCAPQNRVVVFHKVPFVGLIGARKTATWEEVHPDELDGMAKQLGVRRPYYSKFKNIKQCLEYVNTLSADHEGFVIQQWNDRLGRFARAKIKSENYRNLHNLVSCRSLGNLIRFVIKDERACLQDFPEYLDAYDMIAKIFNDYIQKAQDCYDKAKDILEDFSIKMDYKQRRKSFAQQVMSDGYGNIAFSLADGKYSSAKEWLKDQDNNSKVRQFIDQFNLRTIVGDSWNVVDNIDADI